MPTHVRLSPGGGLVTLIVVLVAAAACVTGSGGGGSPSPSELGPTPSRSASDEPSISPARHLAMSQRKIDHVVFIVKENRTFDHLFGRFPGADGATTGL